MKEYENINISQCLTHDISNLNCQQKEITELNQLLTELFPIYEISLILKI